MSTQKTPVVQKYDESSIEVLDFPDAVRKKASYYIGPTDGSGVWTIIREAADNAVDEALAGRNSYIQIHLDIDKPERPQFWIRDQGAGIPVKNIKVRDQSMPAIEAILTKLHSSGKFTDKAYAVARGTHGLGLKATNALSLELEVFTFREGNWYSIQYSRGVKTRELKRCKAPVSPFGGAPLTKGTLLRVIPDSKIFSSMKFPASLVSEWASVSAYFTPKFKVLLTNSKGARKEIYYPEGPKAFTKERIAKLGCTPLSPDVFVCNSALIDCVAQFTDYDGTEFLAFTNGLRNVEGGVHTQAFFMALKAAIDPFVKTRQEFSIQELREGVVGLVNAKLSAPNFDSQTKEKLVDDRAGKPVQALLTAKLKAFFGNNRSLAEKICSRCDELRSLKNKFKASKEILKEIKRVTNLGFPAKATTAPNAKPEQRELFLVEGESAGGSARQARNGDFQELLPLRGKILNAQRAKDEKVLLSEEVLNILAMIGFDPNASNPYDKLRVGKIISLADPDPDGPLHGDTKLHVALDADDPDKEPVWQETTMARLATPEWQNKKYFVLASNGKTFVRAQAHSSRITQHLEKQIVIRFSNDKQVICAPNHQFALQTLRYDARIVGVLQNGMQMIRADRLKTGDQLVAAQYAQPDDDHEGMTALTITKIKEQRCELTPWYCLTVPFYHNFVLSCGVVSKNCHINSLIMTLLNKYLPDLFKRGIVYVAKTPEFYSLAGGKLFGGETPDEVVAKLKKANLKGKVNHIKGYGEVDPQVLAQMAFDPRTRSIVRIKPVDVKGQEEFTQIMGEGSAARKLLLNI